MNLSKAGPARLNGLIRAFAATALAALLVGAAAGPAAAAPQRTYNGKVVSSSVSPSVVSDWETATQTITLSRAAPAGGLDIAVSGDSRYDWVTGGSVHVTAGSVSTTFPIQVGSYDVETVVPLYAQLPGRDAVRIAAVTVRPTNPVTELRFTPDTAVEGATVTGTVVLARPAEAGGVRVEVWSNTSYGPNVYVPRWVTVPAGSTTATFPAVINNASSPSVVRPSAHVGSSTASGKLVVLPTTSAVGPGWFQRGAISDGIVGIGNASNPDGITVTLTVDKPGVSVPGTVVIPAGSPGVTFPVTVSESASVLETGTMTATWNGVSVTTTFFVGY